MVHVPAEAGEPSGNEPLARVWFRMRDVYRDTERRAHRLLYASAPAHALLAAFAGTSGHIVINGLLYPLGPHVAYFIRPGQRVETVYDSDGERLLYRLHFDLIGSGEDGALAERWLEGRGRTSVAPDIPIQPLCKKIADHWHTGDPADRLASQAGFQELLHLLFKHRGPHEEALERARTYMRRHFREAVTVESLAEAAGMSRYYFMRLFKERFGQSVIDCLTELRTNEAKRLMEAGRPLRDVADAVGYKDPLYFSSQFKKQVGIPPRLYIANRKCRTAAYSWPNIGHLLTLQMIPYAAPIDQSWTDDYRRRYRFDIKVPLSHDYEFNREALQRARPDRILALDEMIPEEEKERLQQIAPTLFLRWHQDDWRTHLRSAARFLDREKVGERWLARYDGQVEAVLRRMPASFRQGKLLILNLSPSGLQIWGRRAGTVLYDDLRIPCASGVERIEFTEYTEAERLAAFEADTMLVSVTKDRQSQEQWERLQRSEPWRKLRAVRSGGLFSASGHTWLREPILEYTANRQEHLLQELDLLFRAR